MEKTNHKSNTVSQALAVLDAKGVSYKYNKEFDLYVVAYKDFRYMLFNSETEGVMSLGLDVRANKEFIEQYREVYDYADECLKEVWDNASVKILNNSIVLIHATHPVSENLSEKEMMEALQSTYFMWHEFCEACECGGGLYIPED